MRRSPTTVTRLIYAFLVVVSLLLALATVRAQTEQLVVETGDDYPAVWKDEPTNRLKDSWGMENRQCTSWVAWKVFKTFGYSVTDWGNAYEWPAAAQRSAIKTTTEPLAYSIAVDDSFNPGHVMWVERVNSNGTINVSEYNYKPGEYTQRVVDIAGLTFIDVAGSRL
jgi:surface antigen